MELRRLEPGTRPYVHYAKMRSQQTTDYVLRQADQWRRLGKAHLSIREAFRLLGDFIDQSDPDLDSPNELHMFQAAEAARAAGEPEWMQLVCLIHDLGKIMCRWGTDADGQGLNEQWGCVGDTFVVGCALPGELCAPELNELHPERHSGDGLYRPGCGLKELLFAYGHDEYLHTVLSAHPACRIPAKGLAAIRYHSCYALHSSRAYDRFLRPEDQPALDSTRRLNTYDLYSKTDDLPSPEKLWPYYDELIGRYCPGRLRW